MRYKGVSKIQIPWHQVGVKLSTASRGSHRNTRGRSIWMADILKGLLAQGLLEVDYNCFIILGYSSRGSEELETLFRGLFCAWRYLTAMLEIVERSGMINPPFDIV
uniref:Uncharacterized protein n=1 Tax=Rodentolepis nana TaxID=102285 RepID=A0A0R3T4C4_RODNA